MGEGRVQERRQGGVPQRGLPKRSSCGRCARCEARVQDPVARRRGEAYCDVVHVLDLRLVDDFDGHFLLIGLPHRLLDDGEVARAQLGAHGVSLGNLSLWRAWSRGVKRAIHLGAAGPCECAERQFSRRGRTSRGGRRASHLAEDAHGCPVAGCRTEDGAARLVGTILGEETSLVKSHVDTGAATGQRTAPRPSTADTLFTSVPRSRAYHPHQHIE